MRLLKTEPAAIVAVVVGLFTLLAASGFNLPAEATKESAVAIPILMAGILAFSVRPVKVPLVVAAVVELFVLAAAWGLDLPGPDDAVFLNGISSFLTAAGALVIRMGVTPNSVRGVVDPEVVNARTAA